MSRSYTNLFVAILLVGILAFTGTVLTSLAQSTDTSAGSTGGSTATANTSDGSTASADSSTQTDSGSTEEKKDESFSCPRPPLTGIICKPKACSSAQINQNNEEAFYRYYQELLSQGKTEQQAQQCLSIYKCNLAPHLFPKTCNADKDKQATGDTDGPGTGKTGDGGGGENSTGDGTNGGSGSNQDGFGGGTQGEGLGSSPGGNTTEPGTYTQGAAGQGAGTGDTGTDQTATGNDTREPKPGAPACAYADCDANADPQDTQNNGGSSGSGPGTGNGGQPPADGGGSQPTPGPAPTNPTPASIEPSLFQGLIDSFGNWLNNALSGNSTGNAPLTESEPTNVQVPFSREPIPVYIDPITTMPDGQTKAEKDQEVQFRSQDPTKNYQPTVQEINATDKKVVVQLKDGKNYEVPEGVTLEELNKLLKEDPLFEDKDPKIMIGPPSYGETDYAENDNDATDPVKQKIDNLKPGGSLTEGSPFSQGGSGQGTTGSDGSTNNSTYEQGGTKPSVDYAPTENNGQEGGTAETGNGDGGGGTVGGAEGSDALPGTGGNDDLEGQEEQSNAPAGEGGDDQEKQEGFLLGLFNAAWDFCAEMQICGGGTDAIGGENHASQENLQQLNYNLGGMKTGKKEGYAPPGSEYPQWSELCKGNDRDCRFENLESGLAAHLLKLDSYCQKQGLCTPNGIGPTWCKVSDNCAHPDYGAKAARIAGLDPNAPLDTRAKQIAFVKGQNCLEQSICTVSNDRSRDNRAVDISPYTDEVIKKALEKLGGNVPALASQRMKPGTGIVPARNKGDEKPSPASLQPKTSKEQLKERLKNTATEFGCALASCTGSPVDLKNFKPTKDDASSQETKKILSRAHKEMERAAGKEGAPKLNSETKNELDRALAVALVAATKQVEAEGGWAGSTQEGDNDRPNKNSSHVGGKGLDIRFDEESAKLAGRGNLTEEQRREARQKMAQYMAESLREQGFDKFEFNADAECKTRCEIHFGLKNSFSGGYATEKAPGMSKAGTQKLAQLDPKLNAIRRAVELNRPLPKQSYGQNQPTPGAQTHPGVAEYTQNHPGFNLKDKGGDNVSKQDAAKLPPADRDALIVEVEGKDQGTLKDYRQAEEGRANRAVQYVAREKQLDGRFGSGHKIDQQGNVTKDGQPAGKLEQLNTEQARVAAAAAANGLKTTLRDGKMYDTSGRELKLNRTTKIDPEQDALIRAARSGGGRPQIPGAGDTTYWHNLDKVPPNKFKWLVLHQAHCDNNCGENVAEDQAARGHGSVGTAWWFRQGKGPLLSRPESSVTGHIGQNKPPQCKGECFNSNSIGIEVEGLIGGKLNQEDLHKFLAQVRFMQERYNIRPEQIVYHGKGKHADEGKWLWEQVQKMNYIPGTGIAQYQLIATNPDGTTVEVGTPVTDTSLPQTSMATYVKPDGNRTVLDPIADQGTVVVNTVTLTDGSLALQYEYTPPEEPPETRQRDSGRRGGPVDTIRRGWNRLQNMFSPQQPANQPYTQSPAYSTPSQPSTPQPPQPPSDPPSGPDYPTIPTPPPTEPGEVRADLSCYPDPAPLVGDTATVTIVWSCENSVRSEGLNISNSTNRTWSTRGDLTGEFDIPLRASSATSTRFSVRCVGESGVTKTQSCSVDLIKPRLILNVTPEDVDAYSDVTLSWTAAGLSQSSRTEAHCAVFGYGQQVLAEGNARGTVTLDPLPRSSEFILMCDTDGVPVFTRTVVTVTDANDQILGVRLPNVVIDREQSLIYPSPADPKTTSGCHPNQGTQAYAACISSN